MQISRTEVIPVELPFRERYTTASGDLEGRSMALLRLHSDQGQVGLGEAVPLSLRGGPSLKQVVAELQAVAAAILDGEACDPAAAEDPASLELWLVGLLERCDAHGIGAQSRAAVDIALHDLAGRLTGLPVWRLLGAAEATSISCNASIDARAPAAAAALAAAQAGAGFRTFKIKVGSGADTERVRAVRGGVGAGARLRIDANGAWGRDEAVAALRELESCELELAEQPCGELTDLAAVRALTPTPIVADESVTSLQEAQRAAATGACDAATIKLAKVGGPLRALAIADAVPAYLSSALDGPIGIAAALHTAQALPGHGFAEGLAHGLGTLEMFAATYASAEHLYGPSLLPSGPGLGVEVDEEALQRLRIR